MRVIAVVTIETRLERNYEHVRFWSLEIALLTRRLAPRSASPILCPKRHESLRWAKREREGVRFHTKRPCSARESRCPSYLNLMVGYDGNLLEVVNISPSGGRVTNLESAPRLLTHRDKEVTNALVVDFKH